jgi:23S rRNA pseudouridine1911/1915/1917 synthase
MLEILYEDNHILAVNKKPGDLVQGDKTGDTPLSELGKEYLKIKYQKTGNVFLGVAHRIDRPVSGVVLFARTSKSLERINKMFHDKEIKKTYWAVVKNKPASSEGRLVHYLKKNEAKNQSRAYDKEQPGTLRCELEYTLICSLTNYHLLEVRPLTGRHHQIRVQLAAMGCPIKGDVKYGFDRTNENGSIHLHARKVDFIHPVKDEALTIIAPPPSGDVVWDHFKKAIGEIKS